MLDINEFDEETKAYYDSLPPFVQQEVCQSTQKVEGLEDLVLCVENLVNEGGGSFGNFGVPS